MTAHLKVEIVFRRKVRAAWLDQGLALAAKGVPWEDAKTELGKEIAAENSGTETIRKVLEHIRRIWFEPPAACVALRSAALDLIRSNDSATTRSVLNWGMAISAYPFIGNVAEALGRFLKLQQEAQRAEIQRRLREQFGDRDFVSRITRYDVSSFLDWGVIVETKKVGVYLPGKKIQPKKVEHLVWLAEAVLISRGRTQMSMSELRRHPVMFPIDSDALNASALQTNSSLRVERQSLTQEFVFLDAASSRSAR